MSAVATRLTTGPQLSALIATAALHLMPLMDLSLQYMLRWWPEPETICELAQTVAIRLHSNTCIQELGRSVRR